MSAIDPARGTRYDRHVGFLGWIIVIAFWGIVIYALFAVHGEPIRRLGDEDLRARHDEDRRARGIATLGPMMRDDVRRRRKAELENVDIWSYWPDWWLDRYGGPREKWLLPEEIEYEAQERLPRWRRDPSHEDWRTWLHGPRGRPKP